MGIVKDYKIGNTSIKIADDYCLSKTDEEVEELCNSANYERVYRTGERIKEISGNWNDRRMPGGDGKIY